MIEVNKETIREFSKLLIEFGGFHKLNDDGTIVSATSGEAIAIPEGKHNYPLVLFDETKPCNPDVRYLNPFSETLGVNRDKEKFFSMLSTGAAALIKAIILQTTVNIVEKKDDNYDQYMLMSKVDQFIDDKSYDEFDSIQLTDYFEIFYNKSKKTAEAQCAIFTDDFKAAHPKFRKKTWSALENFYKVLFSDTAIETVYHYQSQLISVPETDAKLHIVITVAHDIDQYCKDLLDIDLHSDRLMEHLQYIEGYAKMYSWAMVRRAEPAANAPVQTQTSNGSQPVVGLSSIPKNIPFNGAAAPQVGNGAMMNAALVNPGQPQQMQYVVNQYGQPVMQPQPQMVYGQPYQQQMVYNKPLVNAAMVGTQMMPQQYQQMYNPQPTYTYANGYQPVPQQVVQQPMFAQQPMHGTYNPITGYQPAPSPIPQPTYIKKW